MLSSALRLSCVTSHYKRALFVVALSYGKPATTLPESASGEALRELFEDGFQFRLDLGRELLAGADRVEHVLVLAPHQPQQLGFKALHRRDLKLVEIAPHAG